MSGKSGKIVLIDGHSLLHRAFFALPTLTTADGVHTNAVYGFTMMLLRLIADEQPGSLAVAFDRSAPTFRHKAFKEYKAHRPTMADELRSQVPLTKEVVRAFNIPIYEIDGYEADDVIGTLARRGESAGMRVLIVTGDKDALQLVSPGVHALITRRGIKEMEIFNEETVMERLGVSPSQVVDVKGLMGDKSDNIPGVPGIGEKTAVRFLKEYGSVENLLERAAEIKGKVGESLRAHADDALLSKRLATIDRDVPLEINWSDTRSRDPDFSRVYELFKQLEFRTLLENLIAQHPELAAVDGARSSPEEGNGARQPEQDDEGAEEEEGEEEGEEKGPSRSGDNQPDVRILTDQAGLEKACDQLARSESLALQAVSDGDAAIAASVVGIVLVSGSAAYYVPLNHDEAPNVEPAGLADLLKSDVPKVCHDAKSQQILLGRLGLTMRHLVDDVMLSGYLLAPGQGDNSLEDLAVKFGEEYPPGVNDLRREDPDADSGSSSSSETGSRGRRGLKPLKEISPERVGRVFGARVAMVARLAPRLAQLLAKDELDALYRDVELPLMHVLTAMERRGIAVDVEQLAVMSAEMESAIKSLEESIYKTAGERFNLNSPKQLARILFEKLNLPVLGKTKTGPSTSAEILEKLAEENEIADRILHYRQVQKLKSTYVDALPALVNPDTGRIHTTFKQAVAATGRLSSANPNLQNIPIRTEAGRLIRRAFIPRDGYTLLRADYSQIELRVLAHVAADENLMQAFVDGLDIHQKTASEIFQVDLSDVTPSQRSAAKAVNFGIVYGISSFGLARGTGLSRTEAQEYIDGYFERYPSVAHYMEDVVANGRETGYVKTILGRRRYLPDLSSRRRHVRNFAERTAINTPIQGSAADIIKAAMVAVESRIRKEGLRGDMLLQVHDELVLEVLPDDLTEVAALVKQEMEGVVSLAVPLQVALKHGPNWLDGESLDL